MYLRRVFKRFKIKFQTAITAHTGIELRHIDNPIKDRSYKNSDIARRFENIEKQRVDDMKEFLTQKDDINQQLDDKILKAKKLDVV